MLHLKDNVFRDLLAASRARDLEKELATALKRFVFRYLRGDDCPISPDLPIVMSGYEELVSRDDAIIKLLPDNMLVGHAYDAFFLMTEGLSRERRKLAESSNHQPDRGEDMNEEEKREVDKAIALSLQPQPPGGKSEDEFEDDLYSLPPSATQDDSTAQTDTSLPPSTQGDRASQIDFDVASSDGSDEFFEADENFDENSAGEDSADNSSDEER
jgi:hypothetical protein